MSRPAGPGFSVKIAPKRPLSVPQSSVYKRFMSLLPKLSGIAAAFGMLVLIALAPTAAFAHGGHDHSHSASIESQAAPAKVDAGAMQELRAADIAVRHAQHDHDCGDRGCCGSGHCAGCVTALAPSALAEFSQLATSLRLTFDAVAPPGLGTSGPARPPRSFV